MTEASSRSNKLDPIEESVMLTVIVKRSQFDKVMRLGRGNRSLGTRLAIDSMADQPYNSRE